MGFFKKVGKAVGGAAKSTVNAGRSSLAALDPTASRSLVGRGLTSASRIPGASSSLIVMTGGLAALNKNVRATGAKEIATGAAVGGGVLAAKLATGKPSLSNVEQLRTDGAIAAGVGATSPGEFEIVDRTAGTEYPNPTPDAPLDPTMMIVLGAGVLVLVIALK